MDTNSKDVIRKKLSDYDYDCVYTKIVEDGCGDIDYSIEVKDCGGYYKATCRMYSSARTTIIKEYEAEDFNILEMEDFFSQLWNNF